MDVAVGGCDVAVGGATVTAGRVGKVMVGRPPGAADGVLVIRTCEVAAIAVRVALVLLLVGILQASAAIIRAVREIIRRFDI